MPNLSHVERSLMSCIRRGVAVPLEVYCSTLDRDLHSKLMALRYAMEVQANRRIRDCIWDANYVGGSK